MIDTLFIPLLERSVNTYLRLDPETLSRIADLQGRVLKIEIHDWNPPNICFYIRPEANGVKIFRHYHEKPDAIIKSPLTHLIRTGLKSKTNPAKLAQELEIEGDIEFAQTISHILQNIEIDWEEYLSHYIGDVSSHQIGRFVRGFYQFTCEAFQQLQRNVSEYLQEESGLLPPREEIEDFFADVRILCDDVDRLEARIKLLNLRACPK